MYTMYNEDSTHIETSFLHTRPDDGHLVDVGADADELVEVVVHDLPHLSQQTHFLGAISID